MGCAENMQQCLLPVSLVFYLLITTFSISKAGTSPFPNPIANPFETRIGSMVQFGVEKLRLDIGVPILLAEPVKSDSTGWLQIGGEFMTWTRLRSEGNFKFPVETIDYWFGVYTSYQFLPSGLEARLRLAHISSHLADGAADKAGTLNPTPFVYSREFVELLFGYTVGYARPYVGATYMWTNQPDRPNAITPQVGVDIRIPINDDWQVLGGYDLRLIGIDGVYAASNAAQLGMLYNMINGHGILVSLYGFSGRSIHGMYYTLYDSYIAAGFQFIL